MKLCISSYYAEPVKLNSVIITLACAFGLRVDQNRKHHIVDNLCIDIEPGSIIFITGPSGSGKSTILRIIKNHLTGHIDLQGQKFRKSGTLVEQFDTTLEDALYYLAQAGLADANLFLLEPGQLSDGQNYRFRLALAMSKADESVIADEFLDNLDRISAKVIAYNLRKFADRFEKTFILASTKRDIIKHLRPDILIEKELGKNAKVTAG